MTNPTVTEVDAAIHSVLADLFGRGGAEVRRAPDAEVFAGRLFALRHAEALGASAREIRLAPGTVVTPLARDFAKARGIAIRTVSAAAVRQVGEWGFAIDQLSGPAAALRRALLDDRDGWQEVPAAEIAPWVGEAGPRGRRARHAGSVGRRLGGPSASRGPGRGRGRCRVRRPRDPAPGRQPDRGRAGEPDGPFPPANLFHLPPRRGPDAPARPASTLAEGPGRRARRPCGSPR